MKPIQDFERYWVDASDGTDTLDGAMYACLKAWSESAFKAGQDSRQAECDEALLSECRSQRAQIQALREALKVAAWWMDSGDDDFMPPWAGSTLDHSEQQERVRRTVLAALASTGGEKK